MRRLWTRQRAGIVSPKAINFFNGPERSPPSAQFWITKLFGECFVILSWKSHYYNYNNNNNNNNYYYYYYYYYYLSVCASVMAVWILIHFLISSPFNVVTFLKIVISCVAHSLFDFSDWMSVPSIDLGHRTGDNCMFCLLNVLILSRLCITRKLALKQTWHPMLVLRTGWHRRSYGEKDTDEK